MSHKYARELTGDELSSVLTALDESTTDLALPVVLFQVMGLLNPEFSSSLDSKIVPSEYGLPKGQWIAIAEAVQKKLGIQGTLDFMNRGPSGIPVEAPPVPDLPPLEPTPEPEPEVETVAEVTEEAEVVVPEPRQEEVKPNLRQSRKSRATASA